MATAAVILGTAVYGAYAQRQSGKEQKNLSDRNASLIDAQAEDAVKRGEEEVMAVRRRTRQIKGQQKAAFATQGVDVNTGTALDLQNESDVLGAQDESTVRRNAWREAWGMKTQAANQRLEGDYAKRAGDRNAIGAILGGVGDAAPYYASSTAPKVGGAKKSESKTTTSKNYGPTGKQKGGGYYGALYG